MKLINYDIRLSIEIKSELVDEICQLGRLHYPKEFGGILIGNYSTDNREVIITDTILPQVYRSSRFNFERGIEGMKERLVDAFDREPSQIYVGEWHTHPDAFPYPSGTDIRALKDIVASEDVNISNPIMLIVGLTESSTSLAFYVYLDNKIYTYEII